MIEMKVYKCEHCNELTIKLIDHKCPCCILCIDDDIDHDLYKLLHKTFNIESV